jgi:Phage minor capsid protein 2
MDKQQKLIKLYEEAGFRLIELIRTLEDGVSRQRKQILLNQVYQIIANLSDDAANLAKEIIEESYKQGSNDAVKELAEQTLKSKEEISTTLSTVIHTQAVQETLDEVFYRILECNDNMSADAKNRIEEITRQANQRSLIEGVSRRQATKDATAELLKTQITGIVAKNGAVIPADKYMANVIQYHQRKAHVEGSINRIIENGEDLIYVNSVGITCGICAVYQGRVYSISGNDSRFPKLDKRPPYHSHCVHSTSAWIEDYQSTRDVKKALTDSNRPFTDNRTTANQRKYEEIQREKSYKNETRKQWIRYKARMPELPSLRVFASHKARNTQKYQEWLEDFRKIGFEINKGKS